MILKTTIILKKYTSVNVFRIPLRKNLRNCKKNKIKEKKHQKESQHLEKV